MLDLESIGAPCAVRSFPLPTPRGLINRKFKRKQLTQSALPGESRDPVGVCEVDRGCCLNPPLMFVNSLSKSVESGAILDTGFRR